MHQFVDAAIAVYNPDEPDRAVNSPKACYQLEETLLAVLRKYGSQGFEHAIEQYKKEHKSLQNHYEQRRQMSLIQVEFASGHKYTLSPGPHSKLIKAIIEEFAPRFGHRKNQVVYVGDTEIKWGYFNKELLEKLNVYTDSHGKMPDVVIYCADKKWVFLVESVTSHGPVDHKRYRELSELFSSCTAELVYVSAFPSRAVMNKFLATIAWETEVWLADEPDHLIHFNGNKFLGPYESSNTAE